MRDVPLVPGENRLVARATDLATDLSSPDSETVLITVPEDAFPDLAVEAATVLAAPPVPLVGESSQLRVRVSNQGAADSGESDLAARILDITLTSRNVRNLIVQEESRLAAVAVQPRRDKALFAYGGAGGKVMLVGVDGDTPVASAAKCAAAFSVSNSGSPGPAETKQTKPLIAPPRSDGRRCR